MPHHDDKGRISPAQSKTARQMRSTPLSERTMGQMGDKGYGGNIHGRHAYGRTHVGVGGMASMAKAREANKGKRAKSRVVLRGQKDEKRKAYTKIGARFHKKGLLHVPKVEV